MALAHTKSILQTCSKAQLSLPSSLNRTSNVTASNACQNAFSPICGEKSRKFYESTTHLLVPAAESNPRRHKWLQQITSNASRMNVALIAAPDSLVT
jgi:hypothetical protein